jgi:hypothetical protein
MYSYFLFTIKRFRLDIHHGKVARYNFVALLAFRHMDRYFLFFLFTG